jgi:uncharacterized protein YdaL
MNQIDLIFHLFPHLDYLSLQYISNDQIEPIVHDTLLKIQKKSIHRPMIRCIYYVDAEYHTVENLQQMIDAENLLHDYTINRQLNKFSVQWK